MGLFGLKPQKTAWENMIVTDLCCMTAALFPLPFRRTSQIKTEGAGETLKQPEKQTSTLLNQLLALHVCSVHVDVQITVTGSL